MGKPAKVQWDAPRLTEADLESGSAIVRFQTDQDVPEVAVWPTPSLTRYLDVQPAGYVDVQAGVWYDVTVAVIGGGPLETTVGGTIQIRGDKGVLAQPLNVSIQVESEDDDGEPEPGRDPSPGPGPEPGDGPEDDDNGLNTIVWTPDVLDAETFADGEIVTVDFSASRDLGKVCVWLTPSTADSFLVTPTMFDPVMAEDDTGAPLVYSFDIELLEPVANLSSNLGGTLHLRDCSSGKMRRTYDTPLPINIVIDADEADAEAAPAAVVSAAGFNEGPIAPNQIVSIFGEGIGPRNLAAFSVVDGLVGTDLGDTIVLFDGVQAPLLATHFGQVNAIVPSAAAGKSAVEMLVIHRGKVSQPFLLAVKPAAPAVFTLDEFGQGAVLNSNGSVNANGNPARRGAIVTIFGTGAGLLPDAALEDGAVVSEPIEFSGDIQVRIDGQPATILWAGAPAGAVNGVLQINLMLPPSARPGIWPIVVTIDGYQGGEKATIAIQ